jgi:uncharacterized membrane protein
MQIGPAPFRHAFVFFRYANCIFQLCKMIYVACKFFFGIAKFSKLGMQNPFSGLLFAFFACNISFQTCGNDPPKMLL